MKTIGMIGGMGWGSSLEYYRIINETVNTKLGGLHSASCILYSLDLAEIDTLQQQGNWAELARLMVSAGQSLERAGADFIILCCNTMHKLADDIQANIHVPFLHIADAAGQKIKAAGLIKIGLLGTRFTMEQDFYKQRLIERFGLDVITPQESDREIINRIIFNELCLGILRQESQEQYRVVMEKLIQAGAGGIILGCTEIELLIHDEDSRVPLFATTKLHALAAVEYALA